MSSRVAILWDYSGCPSPNTTPGHALKLANCLREFCARLGSVTLFKVYCGLATNTGPASPTIEMSSGIEAAGATVVDRSNIGMLIADAFCFWADNLVHTSGTRTIVFVTQNHQLAYTVSALRGRGVNVGFVLPSGLGSEDLATLGSWVLDWGCIMNSANDQGGLSDLDSLAKDVLKSYRGQVASPVDLDSNCGFSLVDDKPSESGDVDNEPLAAHSTGILSQVEQEVAQSQAPAVEYRITKDRVPGPLPCIEIYKAFLYDLKTTIHTLQILETDPLFALLLNDPEAIKIKGWRRKLKQLFFISSAKEDPKAPLKLEELFAEIEAYDKMSKDYLAFSRIGKLTTQISQAYRDDFDYRRPYVQRAEDLTIKWQKVVDAAGI